MLDVAEREVLSEKVLLKGFGRVLDIKVGPEGAICVLLNNPHKVVRLKPAKA